MKYILDKENKKVLVIRDNYSFNRLSANTDSIGKWVAFSPGENQLMEGEQNAILY